MGDVDRIQALAGQVLALASVLAIFVKPAVDVIKTHFAINGRQVLGVALALGVGAALLVWLAVGGPYTLARAALYALGGLAAAGVAATITTTQKRADTVRQAVADEQARAEADLESRFLARLDTIADFWNQLDSQLEAEAEAITMTGPTAEDFYSRLKNAEAAGADDESATDQQPGASQNHQE